MTAATSAQRQLAVFVGIPEIGEIGREEILEALRRAGRRAEERRREAAAALSADRGRRVAKFVTIKQ